VSFQSLVYETVRDGLVKWSSNFSRSFERHSWRQQPPRLTDTAATILNRVLFELKTRRVFLTDSTVYSPCILKLTISNAHQHRHSYVTIRLLNRSSLRGARDIHAHRCANIRVDSSLGPLEIVSLSEGEHGGDNRKEEGICGHTADRRISD
jgi:hypothetical protein